MLAVEREEENDYFRNFLSWLPSAEVDSAVHRLNAELPRKLIVPVAAPAAKR